MARSISFRRVSIGLVTSGRPETTAEAARPAHSGASRAAYRHRPAPPWHADSVAQQRAEARIVFDQHQTLLIDAMLDQRVGDRAGPGPNSRRGLRHSGRHIAPWCAQGGGPRASPRPCAAAFQSMNEENEPRRRDEEAFSTHARTIAKACRYQAGPRIARSMSENSHKDV